LVSSNRPSAAESKQARGGMMSKRASGFIESGRGIKYEGVSGDGDSGEEGGGGDEKEDIETGAGGGKKKMTRRKSSAAD
jgi:hypothetical protein